MNRTPNTSAKAQALRTQSSAGEMVCGAEVTSEGGAFQVLFAVYTRASWSGGQPSSLGEPLHAQISNCICYGCSFIKIIRITELSEIRAN